MTIYVIDASVAMKWLFEKPHREEAKRYLLPSLKQIAPDFVIVECVNAIRKKVVFNQLSQDEGDNGVEMLIKRKDDLFTELFPANDFIKRAYELSKSLNKHPIPDCLYLALAEKENCITVTADRKFYNQVVVSDFSSFLAWVEDPPKIEEVHELGEDSESEPDSGQDINE